ncbi:MAG TPA: hypothetical protein VIV40_13345 [Kofleriaceae bacterium]
MVDSARAFLPNKLDCVVDAALTSEAVALAINPSAGTTIVIVTRAHVAHCPALSRIGSDMFVATIGASSVADKPAASPLGDPRWARARSYLLRDPIAIALDRDGQRALAVAQPSPLAGWLTIDASDVAAAERTVQAWIDRQRSTALAPLVGNLVVQKRGSQLLVRASKLQTEQLTLLAPELLRSFDPSSTAPSVAFACPPTGNGVVRCAGTSVVVGSLTSTLRKLVAVNTDPVISGGDVVGIRLSEDPEVLLRRGDVVLGLDGQRITSAAQLSELARYVHERTALAVRRDGTDMIIELSE